MLEISFSDAELPPAAVQLVQRGTWRLTLTVMLFSFSNKTFSAPDDRVVIIGYRLLDPDQLTSNPFHEIIK